MVKAVSVSQLNSYINRVLSTDPILVNVSVVGELSGLTKHSSGHWYFSLKDDKSTIRCFLSKERVSKLRFELEEGMKLTVWGNISVYERGGSYSLNIRDVDILGEGDLKKAFDLLMKKLSAEGIFDEAHKNKIPFFPENIAVITSPTGAAVRDIITTIKRRNPLVNVMIYPTLVQGPDASCEISNAIDDININFNYIDLIIVGRGGGSPEDLWPFNEESVARAIYKSTVPIISAVGHEIDYVISDYAADLRAATPTAAAELAVPDISVYVDILNSLTPDKLLNLLISRYENEELRIKHYIEMSRAYLDSVLNNAIHRLTVLKMDLDGLNPLLQLSKGYSLAKDENGKWISSIEMIECGSKFSLLLKDGSLSCKVEGKQKNAK